MKTYLFPGQGSQQVGMGKDLFPHFREQANTASEILGYSIEDLCLLDSNQALNNTSYTQPAIYVVSVLSYLKQQEENSEVPDFVAGHSLGEFTALFAAGMVTFETGLKLVQKRGEIMETIKDGGMAAVIGLDETIIRNILLDNNIETIDLANINSGSQIVISGPKSEILKAKPIFETNGCQMYVPLKVSGAFHSRYMEAARQEFKKSLEATEFSEPKIPIISNVTARPYQSGKYKEYLEQQLTSPVRWADSMHYLIEKGPMDFFEIGPGTVLTRLIDALKKESVVGYS